MELEIWLALIAASATLLAIPGPVVVLLLSQVFTHGRRIAVGAILGVALGDLVAITVSLAGAGAVLIASATLFTILKLAGALYLIWLGIGLWRHGFDAVKLEHVEVDHTTPSGYSRWRAFRQAFVVTALNPKDIVFFVAFLPQFITPDRSATPQIVIIIMTFVALVAFSTSLWVAFADRLRSGLTHSRTRLFVARSGAGALIGAGAFTALAGNT